MEKTLTHCGRTYTAAQLRQEGEDAAIWHGRDSYAGRKAKEEFEAMAASLEDAAPSRPAQKLFERAELIRGRNGLGIVYWAKATDKDAARSAVLSPGSVRCETVGIFSRSRKCRVVLLVDAVRRGLSSCDGFAYGYGYRLPVFWSAAANAYAVGASWSPANLRGWANSALSGVPKLA